MKHKKKMLFSVVTMFLVSILLFTQYLGVYADEIYAAKKIISIVYDDSGSMDDSEGSWSSANYAMQVFAALLDRQDEMYITYMSDVTAGKNVATEMDMSKPEATVKSIREDGRDFGSTPLEAVDVAMEKLTDMQGEGENTQFWLVILTDGDMSYLHSGSKKTLQQVIDDYAGTKMCNGSEVYITYMGIGSRASKINGNASKGVEAKQAGADIVPSLFEIANKVSGRLVFEDSEITKVDGKTIRVKSDVPLYNISVFSQGKELKVESANFETSLKVDRNIALKYPEKKHNAETTNQSLLGNAAVISNGDKVIPAGEYEIVFSEDISLEDTVIMYQPAIAMRVDIKRNGVEVDVNQLNIDDVIDIEIVPVNPETGEVLKESALPEGITWGIIYDVDGTVVEDEKTNSLTGVTVGQGKNKIKCEMNIPELVPGIEVITFTPEYAVNYGISVNQPDLKNGNYSRRKLGMNGWKNGPVTFQITADGVPMKKDQLGTATLDIALTEVDDSNVKGFFDCFGFIEATPTLKLNDDGSFAMYPKASVIPAFLLKAGTYTVTVELNKDASITATGSYVLVPSIWDWIDLWWLLILLAIIGYLLYIFFVKPKFDGQILKVQVYSPNASTGGGVFRREESAEDVLTKFGKDLLLPWAASKSVAGLKVYAGSSGEVYLKKKTISAYEAYGSTGRNPMDDYVGIVSGLKTVKGNEGRIPDVYTLGRRAFYLKRGNRLYKITVQ